MSDEKYVAITQDEYRDMIKDSVYLEAIMDAVYEGARLDYSGKDLYLDDSALKTMLKVLDKMNYSIVIKRLKDEAEKKEEVETDASDV